MSGISYNSYDSGPNENKLTEIAVQRETRTCWTFIRWSTGFNNPFRRCDAIELEPAPFDDAVTPDDVSIGPSEAPPIGNGPAQVTPAGMPEPRICAKKTPPDKRRKTGKLSKRR